MLTAPRRAAPRATGMAAFMASTYKCYLGEGWSKWVEGLRIPHPGRVVGRLVMLLTMPSVLEWVLGGNTDHVAPHRTSYCSLGDKPKVSGCRAGGGWRERRRIAGRRGRARQALPSWMHRPVVSRTSGTRPQNHNRTPNIASSFTACHAWSADRRLSPRAASPSS